MRQLALRIIGTFGLLITASLPMTFRVIWVAYQEQLGGSGSESAFMVSSSMFVTITGVASVLSIIQGCPQETPSR